MPSLSRSLFLAKKSSLPTFTTRSVPLPPTSLGQIRVEVDRFSFTANNMTYANAGDGPAQNYW